MSPVNIKNLTIGLVMLLAAGLALALTPRAIKPDEKLKLDLETVIPKQFSNWHLDESITPLQVNPNLKAELAEIYSQTLSRTYINEKGERVMLSIAYGSNQSRSMQVHRPEVCYSAQGFQIQEQFKDSLQVGNGNLPVMRLVAVQGQRSEPITYWVKIGDTAVRGNLEQGFARLKYGLTGKVPDGMLVRVSSISSQSKTSYILQGKFVQDMLNALPNKDRELLTGAL
jgi:EpsI family protein